MANTKSTQHEIDLTSSLNLNKFKADIKPYEGFNERNSPYYGGCLSPLWIRDNGTGGNSTFYKGHEYYTQDGKLFRDSREVLSFDTRKFVKTKLKDVEGFESKNVLDFFDIDNYIELKDNGDFVIHHEGIETIISESDYFYKDSIFSYYNGHTYFALMISDGRHDNVYYEDNSTTYIRQTSGKWGFLDKDILLVTDKYVQINTSIWNKTTRDYMLLQVSGESNNGVVVMKGNTIYFNDQNKINTTTEFAQIVNIIKARIQRTAFLNYHPYWNAGVNERQTMWSDANYCLPIIFIGRKNGACNYYYEGDGLFSTGQGGFSLVFYNRATWEAYSSSARTVLPVDSGGWGHVWENESETYYLNFRNTSIPSEVTINFTSKEGEHLQGPGLRCSVISDYPMQQMSSIDTVKRNDFIHVSDGMGIIQGAVYQGGNVKTRITYNGTSRPWYRTARTEIKNTLVPTTVGDIQENFKSFKTGDNYSDCLWRLSAISISPSVGIIEGISYCNGSLYEPAYNITPSGGYGESYIGTLINGWGTVDNSKNVYVYKDAVYYDDDLNDWVTISIENDGNNDFTILEDYIVINTVSYKNCIRLSSLLSEHWASDWTNNICSINLRVASAFCEDVSYTSSNNTQYSLASAQSTNYTRDQISSRTSASNESYWDGMDGNITANRCYSNFVRPLDDNYVEIFKDLKYFTTFNGTALVEESSLIESKYPGDDQRNNIPLLFKVVNSPLDMKLITYGSNVSFFLIYGIDNKLTYQYYTSSILEFEDLFIVQGSAYGIKNDRVYTVIVGNNTVQQVSPVVNITGLVFITNTIYNAYFYSPTAKAIYSFGADNNLQLFTQADTITGITGSSYMPSTGSIIIGTPDCTYVLNERFGIYRINDIKNFAYADQKEKSVVLVLNNNYSYEVSYEKPEETEGWVNVPVILDTSYYGAGSNVVSVNDCWYVRVTDPEHGTGEIKLAVSTLTDVGRQTETKTVKVKASDWDELTDTVYIRFQPKLQRAVGVSLHIESPFKVGYIGVGATPETLQLNKVNI